MRSGTGYSGTAAACCSKAGARTGCSHHTWDSCAGDAAGGAAAAEEQTEFTVELTAARLKYMKSLQAELAHIVDVVNRLSLAHPEVAYFDRCKNHTDTRRFDFDGEQR